MAISCAKQLPAVATLSSREILKGVATTGSSANGGTAVTALRQNDGLAVSYRDCPPWEIPTGRFATARQKYYFVAANINVARSPVIHLRRRRTLAVGVQNPPWRSPCFRK